jgi:uncharacterized membrane protein
MLNPFDLKSALLAKHAQHVVLIHFPIALYLSGTAFDFTARIFRKPSFLEAARWNFVFAAILSIPAMITGLIAWRWALEGKTLKGVLLLHVLLACVVVVGLWATVWLRSRSPQAAPPKQSSLLLSVEVIVCLIVSLTAHLGGFLSGVNGGP